MRWLLLYGLALGAAYATEVLGDFVLFGGLAVGLTSHLFWATTYALPWATAALCWRLKSSVGQGALIGGGAAFTRLGIESIWSPTTFGALLEVSTRVGFAAISGFVIGFAAFRLIHHSGQTPSQA